MLVFPVRHHSPAAALQVSALIRERRPKAVLIEGPADASELIPLLLDQETRPPVALYAYYADGPAGGGKDGAQAGRNAEEARVQAIYYPFADYSPELAALRAGQKVGAKLAFCDVPAGETLRYDATHELEDDTDSTAPDGTSAPQPPETGASPAPTALPGYGAFAEAVTRTSGYETFEEFWEAAFEQDAGARTVHEYVSLLTTFGAQSRSFDAGASDRYHDRREQHMAAMARRLVAEGIGEEEIVLVCGAAHAEAIARYFAEGALDPAAPSLNGAAGAGVSAAVAGAERDEARETQIALIPFSFPRLSEQLGYGAGNRAPWFYQEVWRLGGDYGEATRHGLVALARHLRTRGLSASLAQCIDGYTLALTLAGIRQKRAPGVDELRDAAVACFGAGQTATVSTALTQILVGNALGTVTPRVGRTPLQAEFYATTAALGLPVLDQPKQVLLHMVAEREARQSIFLHRLAVTGVPYGVETESGLGGRRAATASPLQQLARVREKWELQWSPATDARLVERTAWGSTLREVCARLLGEQLAAAGRIDTGTAVLLRMALCDLADALPAATARCETLAADSASFAALARAAYHLDGLLSYGAARRLATERLAALARRLFSRAVLHLPASAACSDEAAVEVQETLTALHEMVSRRSAASADGVEGFWSAIESVATMPASHPTLRGLALVLLEIEGRLGSGELATRLRYWLSRSREAPDNARLVAGLFSLHRGTLVRNSALIAAVSEFLSSLEIERLIPLLPVLRRSLGDLSPAERSYLSETLARVLGIRGNEAGVALRLSATDLAVLREADAAVASVLAGWKERYGIG